MLQRDESEFIRLAAERSSRPLNTTAILVTNHGRVDHGSRPNGAMLVDSVPAESARNWITQHQACVLDARERWQYTLGYIRAAISMLQADLAV
jgi:hypothetical protein